ncbi:MAG: SprB repeat-containing protein [Niabella sp.]
MKKIVILFILLSMYSLASFAQSLSASVSTSPATCPANGSITVSASGGTSPYLYSLTGTINRDPQSSNIFANLPAGTYNAKITDNNNAAYTVSSITVSSSYATMNPTATAVREVCPGSNSGSITLSMPSGQGTAPYSYSISTDGTNFTTIGNNITSTSYTFQNKAPGFYYVRVTDACNAFQTREATLVAAPTYNLTIGTYVRPSGCDNMDYYLKPGIGSNYPHTYYAYKPDGSFTTITVTAADLVQIPGTTFIGFKFTLPNPPNFEGTYYTFKYTDACVTNPNSTYVKPTTPTLGQYYLNAVNVDCQLSLEAKIGEGWVYPVTVSLTPNGGTALPSQQITDQSTRSTIFTNLTSGNYTATFTDYCGNTITKNFNLVPPALGSSIVTTCASNIPGTISIDIYNLEQGWKTPVTATITNGPTSYYSPFMGKTYTATYPISAQPMINNIIRFANMAPGTYTIELNDGCNTKTVNYTAVPPGTTYTIPRETVTGCAGSRKLNLTATQTCANSPAVNIRKGTTESVYANGATYTYTKQNVPADLYTLYYYSGISNVRTNVLSIPTSDIYQGNFLVKKDTITVTDAPTNPQLAGAATASCTDGSIAIKLFPTNQSSQITSYELQNADGQTFGTPQSSPNFTINAYGSYTFRITDECGNSGVSAVNIAQNPMPVIKFAGNACLGNDINLYVEIPDYATAVWTKPNGSKVQGTQLNIPNASEADKGQYSVTVTYTVGGCSEVKTSSTMLDNCLALPVNWGMFSALIKDGKLIVNWSTLMENNNAHFEIQVSKDGKNFIPIGTVVTKAVDGNSSKEISYEFIQEYSKVAGAFAISIALGLLTFGFNKKKNILKVIAVIVLASGLFVACKRGNDTLNIAEDNAKIWVRIVQIDKDGTQKTSSIVQAIRD